MTEPEVENWNDATPPTSLGEDIRWFHMLLEYLPRSPIRLTQNPRIINIGCGNRPNKYPGKQFDTSSKGEPLVMDKYILLATR